MTVRPIIITTANPFGGGGQIRNYNVLLNIAKYIDTPNTTLILMDSPSIVATTFQRLGYNVKYIKSLGNLLSAEQKITKIIRVVESLHYDHDLIVSQTELPSYIISAYLLHKILKIPWTAIIQSYFWLDPFHYGLSPLTIMRTTLSSKLVTRTLVHVVSESIPYYLRNLGIYLRRYEILDVPVGIDIKKARKARKETWDKIYDIAYMARLTKGKGLLDVLYVTYKLSKYLTKYLNKDKLKVLVLGSFADKELRVKFLHYMDRLKLHKYIVYKGYVSGLEKYRLLAKAKLFFYPSKIDAFPVSLVEAFAVGLPAVILQSPFSRQFEQVAIVARNLDEATQHIMSLLLNNQEREYLSRKGIKFAEKFTYESATKSEYKAYLKTLKKALPP